MHINESLAKWMQDLSVSSYSLQLHIHNLITVSHDHTACAVLWSLERWAAWWQLNFQSCRQLRQINLHIHITATYQCHVSVGNRIHRTRCSTTSHNFTASDSLPTSQSGAFMSQWEKNSLNRTWLCARWAAKHCWVSLTNFDNHTRPFNTSVHAGHSSRLQTMQGAACCIQVQVRHKVRIQPEEHRVELGGAC